MKHTKQQTIITPNTEVQIEFLQNQPRKRVGILGGNFNPVHQAHLIIADQVFHQLCLDKIYLMPSYESPHIDGKQTIDSHYRVEMLELAIEHDENIELELIEIERKGKSYTYDTIKELQEKNPDIDYFFIIGGDMVEYLPKWHKIDELVQMVQFIGVNRPDYAVESSYPIMWVDVPLMRISSSMIRKKVSEHCSINYLLPENVINYIQEKELYQDEWNNSR